MLRITTSTGQSFGVFPKGVSLYADVRHHRKGILEPLGCITRSFLSASSSFRTLIPTLQVTGALPVLSPHAAGISSSCFMMFTPRSLRSLFTHVTALIGIDRIKHCANNLLPCGQVLRALHYDSLRYSTWISYQVGAHERLRVVHKQQADGKASPGTGFHKRWLLKKRISAAQKSQK